MSALPPKADIHCDSRNVCFVPIADIDQTRLGQMNVATNNWTVIPQDFESVRRQWEYSHAVNAVLTFVALVTITLSTLTYKREIQMTPPAK